jgi:hypothetical protein
MRGLFRRSVQQPEAPDPARSLAPEAETLPEVLDRVAARLGVVAAATDRAVAGIRADAVPWLPGAADPDGSVSPERMAGELLEALAQRAEELHREAEDLAKLLSRASDRLAEPPANGPRRLRSQRFRRDEPQPSHR